MNSPYASSTTTMPSVASYAAAIVSSGAGVPVGLFGAQRKTMSGRSRSISATAVSGESRKSVVALGRRSTRVPVAAAMIGYME